MTDRKLTKRIEFQSEIIGRQSEEIRNLKKQVERLLADNKKKDALIQSITDVHGELIEAVDDLKAKKAQYDRLMADLKAMKAVFVGKHKNHKR